MHPDAANIKAILHEFNSAKRTPKTNASTCLLTLSLCVEAFPSSEQMSMFILTILNK